MDIILLERIEKLGTIGDVVNVRDGYARNFLLPQKKALRANKANTAVFEANRERLVSENADRRTTAEAQGETVAGAEIVLIRAASTTGQLYGSVSARDIATSLTEQGHKVDKKHVVLGDPIKLIGMIDVNVTLHPEVTVVIKANVARSEDEAALQTQGIDVIAQMSEAEREEGEGFTEAHDPDRELGDLPSAEGEDDEAAADGEEAAAEEAPAAEEATAEEAASEE